MFRMRTTKRTAMLKTKPKLNNFRFEKHRIVWETEALSLGLLHFFDFSKKCFAKQRYKRRKIVFFAKGFFIFFKKGLQLKKYVV